MTSIQSQKNWFTASRITKKMFPSYLEVKKTGSQLFVRSKEKDYDIYLESEKRA